MQLSLYWNISHHRSLLQTCVKYIRLAQDCLTWAGNEGTSRLHTNRSGNCYQELCVYKDISSYQLQDAESDRWLSIATESTTSSTQRTTSKNNNQWHGKAYWYVYIGCFRIREDCFLGMATVRNLTMLLMIILLILRKKHFKKIIFICFPQQFISKLQVLGSFQISWDKHNILWFSEQVSN